MQRIEAKFSLDSNQPRLLQEITSGLKALRFECKLSVTSADCMHVVSVPPFVSVRDSSAMGSTGTVAWTQAAVQSVVDTHNSYMSLGGAADLQVEYKPSSPRCCLLKAAVCTNMC